MTSQPEHKVPRCRHCAYYFITHDARFRYGCHALDFKSEREPILDVLEASGQQCLYFQPKGAAREVVW